MTPPKKRSSKKVVKAGLKEVLWELTLQIHEVSPGLPKGWLDDMYKQLNKL